MLGCVYLQDGWANHVILGSSIIYGPQSPVPVSRPLLLDFIVWLPAGSTDRGEGLVTGKFVGGLQNQELFG